jgi:hypothetical protein
MSKGCAIVILMSLQPIQKWDGYEKEHEYEINDSDYDTHALRAKIKRRSNIVGALTFSRSFPANPLFIKISVTIGMILYTDMAPITANTLEISNGHNIILRNNQESHKRHSRERVELLLD